MEQKNLSDGDFRTIADFSLVNQLMKRASYKIPDYLREHVLKCAERGMTNCDDRIALQAAKLIILADKHNLKEAELAMPKKIEHNIKQMSDEDLLKELADALAGRNSIGIGRAETPQLTCNQHLLAHQSRNP